MHTQKQPAEKQPGISPDCSNGNYPCALSIWYCCILLMDLLNQLPNGHKVSKQLNVSQEKDQ